MLAANLAQRQQRLRIALLRNLCVGRHEGAQIHRNVALQQRALPIEAVEGNIGQRTRDGITQVPLHDFLIALFRRAPIHANIRILLGEFRGHIFHQAPEKFGNGILCRELHGIGLGARVKRGSEPCSGTKKHVPTVDHDISPEGLGVI